MATQVAAAEDADSVDIELGNVIALTSVNEVRRKTYILSFWHKIFMNPALLGPVLRSMLPSKLHGALGLSVVTFDTFTCFPHLPPEIRIKIWRYSCHPQIIPISCPTPTPHPKDARLYKLKSPAVLIVSYEARQEALKLYFPCRSRSGPTDPTLYVNYNSDTFFITNSPKVPSTFNQLHQRTAIQHLVTYIGFYDVALVSMQLTRLRYYYPNLKTLTIWRDRRKIKKDGTLGDWIESAWDSKPRGKWMVMAHEERFVLPRTDKEIRQAELEAAALQPFFEAEKIRNPAWPLEEVQIVFLNPKVRYGYPQSQITKIIVILVFAFAWIMVILAIIRYVLTQKP